MSCKPMTEETRKWIHEKFGHLWPEDDSQEEAMIYEEARNIALNAPVWPGDTVSHRGAKLVSDRGWAVRNDDGYWIPTKDNPFMKELK